MTDDLIYDVRPEVTDRNDSKDADSKPTEAVKTEASQEVLKSWRSLWTTVSGRSTPTKVIVHRFTRYLIRPPAKWKNYL